MTHVLPPPRPSRWRCPRPLAVGLGLGLVGLGALACDGGARARDAAPLASAESSVVRLRLELPDPGQIQASVLAFRATHGGLGASAVLGLVDPLAEEAPAPAEGCVVRSADLAVSTPASGRVDLSELPGIEMDLVSPAGGAVTLRPPAELYPDLGTDVRGVVSASGPVPLGALPADITLRLVEPSATSSALSLPDAARVVSISTGLAYLTLPGDVEIRTSAPDVTVEVRPFGSTTFVACRVGVDGRVRLPGDLVGRAAGPSATHLSLNVVRRATHAVNLGGQPVTAIVELRTSRVLELHR